MDDEVEREGFHMPCGLWFDTEVQVLLHSEHCVKCAASLSVDPVGYQRQSRQNEMEKDDE